MEFQKVLETRRSVRKYDPNVSVTREQMEELIRAAQEAPSWKNSQTGRYYCVLSEEIADKIRETCLPQARNAEKSKHAALIISTFVHNCAGFQKDGILLSVARFKLHTSKVVLMHKEKKAAALSGSRFFRFVAACPTLRTGLFPITGK